jgi:hypothetical protein
MLVARIHVLWPKKTWMAGPDPAKTREWLV